MDWAVQTSQAPFVAWFKSGLHCTASGERNMFGIFSPLGSQSAGSYFWTRIFKKLHHRWHPEIKIYRFWQYSKFQKCIKLYVYHSNWKEKHPTQAMCWGKKHQSKKPQSIFLQYIQTIMLQKAEGRDGGLKRETVRVFTWYKIVNIVNEIFWLFAKCLAVLPAICYISWTSVIKLWVKKKKVFFHIKINEKICYIQIHR